MFLSKSGHSTKEEGQDSPLSRVTILSTNLVRTKARKNRSQFKLLKTKRDR